MVKVYSSIRCSHCNDLKKFLNKNSIKFENKDIILDNKAREEVLSLGAKSIPVLVYKEDIVFGFDENKIREILNINS